MTSFRDQRESIQRRVDGYFGRAIEISPRGFSALQGLRRTQYERRGTVFIEPSDILDGLLQSSPASVAILRDAGVPFEFLIERWDSDTTSEPGVLSKNSLELVFRGVRNRPWELHDYPLPSRCASYERVRTSGRLFEDDLLRAFLETIYVGPTVVRELANAEEFAGVLGSRLFRTGFVHDDEVIESTDPSEYRAKLAAGQRLEVIRDTAANIEISDPSHELQQLAMWQDPAGKILVRPFGVSRLGRSAELQNAHSSTLIFRENFFQAPGSVGSFSASAVLKLEDMINSSRSSEADFQRFFEQNPEFLTGLDYSRVHSQLVLFDESGVGRIPDFMLEPMSSEFCDLLELKLPYDNIVRRLRNARRTRFRDFVGEAVAQLLEYRRYFESPANRKEFHRRYGLEAYYPTMILVCGRRHHFRSDVERRELRALLPADLALWTYDDVLDRARQYRTFQQHQVR